MGGLALPSHQAVFHPMKLLHETSIIPSTSTPQFSGYYVLDLRDKGNKLDNVSIVLNISQLTASDGNQYAFVPSYFMFSRIEAVVGNNIIDTYYPSQMFLENQFFYKDDERLTHNNLAANYASLQQRLVKASKTSEYHINLKSFIDQIKPSILQNHDELQLRVFLLPLADIVDWSQPQAVAMADYANQIQPVVSKQPTPVNNNAPDGVIPSATIYQSWLVVKHTKLNQSGLHQVELKERMKNPQHSLFHDVRYSLQNITLSSTTGVSQYSLVLSSLVGKVAFLMFHIRPVGQTTNAAAWRFLDIQAFDLISSDGHSLCGGSNITYAQNQKHLHQWTQSSYAEETIYNANLVGGITDNAANVFVWSFSDNPVEALTKGQALTSHEFRGSEQLRLWINPDTFYFNKAGNPTNLQVDIFAFCENVYQVSSRDVKKISL